MKQKLGLTCSLVHTPHVLLLDEPTTGVDPVSRREFWQILYSLRAEGVTILISTAYLDEAERCTASRCCTAAPLLYCDTPARFESRMPGVLVRVRLGRGRPGTRGHGRHARCQERAAGRRRRACRWWTMRRGGSRRSRRRWPRPASPSRASRPGRADDRGPVRRAAAADEAGGGAGFGRRRERPDRRRKARQALRPLHRRRTA